MIQEDAGGQILQRRTMPSRMQHENLSFCEFDGHFIFLDIERDRYFILPDALEVAFNAHQQGSDIPQRKRTLLTKHGVISSRGGEQEALQPSLSTQVVHSALEESATTPGFGPCALLEVMALTFSTHYQLKRHALSQVLDRCIATRPEVPESPFDTLTHDCLLTNARRFLQARTYVPTRPTCLLDSLTMVRFLSRRGFSARLVFGVTHAPFSAHCWVQAGPWVLNDTVGNVHGYRPIRVV